MVRWIGHRKAISQAKTRWIIFTIDGFYGGLCQYNHLVSCKLVKFHLASCNIKDMGMGPWETMDRDQAICVSSGGGNGYSCTHRTLITGYSGRKKCTHNIAMMGKTFTCILRFFFRYSLFKVEFYFFSWAFMFNRGSSRHNYTSDWYQDLQLYIKGGTPENCKTPPEIERTKLYLNRLIKRKLIKKE